MRQVIGAALAALLATQPATAQVRGAPAVGTPSPVGTIAPLPAHNVGVQLASTPLYDLYEYRMAQGWCVQGFAAVVVLFKVEPSYEVVVNDEYRGRFAREILPVVRAQCPTLRRVSVFNHVKGFILEGATVRTYEEAAQVRREAPLSSFIVTIGTDGAPSFPADVGGVRSIAAAQARAGQVQTSNAEYTRVQEAERAAAAQAEARLTARTRTDDGLLRLEGFSNEHKQLLLQIYAGEFAELARVDQPHYRPFQVYTALIQGYGDRCRQSLVDPIQVQFYGDQRVRTEVGPFVQTDYFNKHLMGVVYVERRHEQAYRMAGQSHLTRMLEYWRRNMSGDNLLAFYTTENLKGIGLAQAAHQLVTLNGCTSPGLAKFIATLTEYVSDRWTPATGDGGYRFAQEERPGDIVRRYEKVPAGFRPPFPVLTDKPIVVLLNEAEGGIGLSMMQVKWFTHAPLAAKGQINRISTMTPAVRAAIAERRYQVGECTYLSGTGSRTDFYWNANAPLPTAEVQAYFEGVIGAARDSCPAAAGGG